MKQKRKVKGQKFTESNKFLASLLVLLWGAFCMGALSLFTVPNVWWQTSLTTLSYTWLESKNEVVYDMFFIDKGNQEIINEIYMKKDGDNRNFYISWNSVVLGNLLPNYEGLDKVSVLNLVWEGKYSNILWWDHNNINSSNITIIAGVSNAISEWNDNATIVWSAGSNVSTWGGNVPLVLVWWSNNEIGSNQNGTVIIWWNWNKIFDNVSNSQILGWNGNKVAVDNVIVAWNNVEATPSGEWSFVFNWYSTEVFRPNSTNSFFLNVEKGVWLNMEASNGGLASKWAISIGEIDKSMCTSDNIWMQWVLSGCLVWCTKEWILELLDTSERCLELLPGMRKIKPPKPQPFPNAWVCDSEWVDTGNATICGDPTGYVNAIFEVKLIDANRDTWITCPNEDNQCVYQCNYGYHLDLVDGKCHKDCDLPWNSSEYIRHGKTVTWYSSSSTTCTNTCSMYEMILTCNDGVLYDSDGRENKDYTNEDCVLNDKVCSAITYPFTSCPENGICEPADWWQCDEYQAKGKSQCIYTGSLFQLTDCKPWYTFVDEGWVRSCKENCTYEKDHDTKHGEQKGPYTSNGWECTNGSDGCNYKPIICDNGTWYLSPNVSNIKAWSFSISCSYKGESCDWYTISQAEKDAWEKEWKKYRDCQKLSGGEQCTKWDMVYMEDGCDGNHWPCGWSCIPNCGVWQHEDYSNSCSCVDDVVAVDWVCGSVKDTCDAWTWQDVTDSSTQYKWKCLWENGWNDSSICTANIPPAPVNWVCGTSEFGDCKKWDYQYVDSETWKCLGKNGWSDVECQAIDGYCEDDVTPYCTCVIWEPIGCISGTHNDTWSCEWIHGWTADSCIYNKGAVNWKCGSAKDTCDAWTWEDVTDSSTQYKWKCLWSNGWSDSNTCTADIPAEKIIWVCWSTKDTCTAWTYEDVTDTDTQYKWKCLWSNGWSDRDCSKDKPVNWACSTTVDKCTAWTYQDVTDTEEEYKWKCLWSNGWSDRDCSKYRTRSVSCGSAPANSSWVVSTFTQSWHGSAWVPWTKSATCVNSSSSTTECSFKCNSGKVCDWNSWCKDCDNSCSGNLYTACPEWYKIKTSVYTNNCGNTCYECEVDPEKDVCPEGYSTSITSIDSCIGISCSEYWSAAWSISTASTAVTHTPCWKCVPKDPCTDYTVSTNSTQFNLTDCVVCGCPRSANAGKAKCDCATPYGYTQGNPPTNDCYNYDTTTKCGKSYYKRWTSKCASNQTCSNWTCVTQSNNWWWGGWGCFLAWTQVHMADWATKNIEDIEVWDMVLTYNTETKQNEYNKVLKKYVHENNTDNLYEFTINWNVLTVTAPHRFYVVLDENDGYKCPYNWIPAARLKVWYDLLMYDGSVVTIEDKVRHSHYGTVYNLLVENNNNYYVAEWYLVHNLNWTPWVQVFSSCGDPAWCRNNSSMDIIQEEVKNDVIQDP